MRLGELHKRLGDILDSISDDFPDTRYSPEVVIQTLDGKVLTIDVVDRDDSQARITILAGDEE